MTFTAKRKNFTMFSNVAINDERLSWKAKGILSYCMSKPEGWKFYLSEMIKHCEDGIDSTRTGLRQLMQAGYYQEIRSRDEKGRMTKSTWIIDDVPTHFNPLKSDESGEKMFEEIAQGEEEELKECLPRRDFPHVDRPYVEEFPLVNTEYNNTKKTTTTSLVECPLKNSVVVFFEEFLKETKLSPIEQEEISKTLEKDPSDPELLKQIILDIFSENFKKPDSYVAMIRSFYSKKKRPIFPKPPQTNKEIVESEFIKGKIYQGKRNDIEEEYEVRISETGVCFEGQLAAGNGSVLQRCARFDDLSFKRKYSEYKIELGLNNIAR